MALELAKHNSVYEDIASKFFEVCFYADGVLDKETNRSDSTSYSLPTR